jgi:hypothetical protein
MVHDSPPEGGAKRTKLKDGFSPAYPASLARQQPTERVGRLAILLLATEHFLEKISYFFP